MPQRTMNFSQRDPFETLTGLLPSIRADLRRMAAQTFGSTQEGHMFEGTRGEIGMAAASGMPSIANSTKTERLKRQRDELSARLQELNAALDVIEANPKFQEVIDALAKLNL